MKVPVDIRSHILGYSNKGRNPSAGIKLKTCFLQKQDKTKTKNL